MLCLAPFGGIYYALSRAKQALTSSTASPIPLICVGNATMGGAGKTPSCLYLLGLLRAFHPVLLTRGYGGATVGPYLVKTTDDPALVGDEPLLLAEKAPVIKSINRRKGLGFILQNFPDCRCILMDDGYQNPSLHKDIHILIIDEASLSQQQYLFPAGPMREPFAHAAQKADFCFITGTGESTAPLKPPSFLEGIPTFHVTYTPRPDLQKEVSGQDLLAFCGIARPEKFYQTLRSLAPKTISTIDFADHQAYTPDLLTPLYERAARENRLIVTTRKDAVKLPPHFLQKTTIIDVDLTPKNMADEVKISQLLNRLIIKASQTNA